MEYYGLQQLFTMAGPGATAWNNEMKTLQDQELATLVNQQKQAELVRSAATLPFTAEKEQADIAYKKALTRDTEARAASTELDTETKKEINPLKIDVTKEQLRLEQMGQRIQQVDNWLKAAGQAATIVANSPNPEVEKQKFLASGIIQGPFLDVLKQLPAKDWSKALIQMNKELEQGKSDYIRKMAELEEQRKTQTQLLDMQIKAGRFSKNSAIAQDIAAQAQAGKLSFERAATAFQILGMQEENPQLREKYLNAAKQFEEAALRQKQAAQAGKPDVGQMGIPERQVSPALGPQPLPQPQSVPQTRPPIESFIK